MNLSSKEFIILVAGQGTRFGSATPKCLSEINGEQIIHRIVRQIKLYSFNSKIKIILGYKYDLIKESLKDLSEIEFIYNSRYFDDQNIYSALCGIKDSNSGCLIIEGDCIFEDNTIKEVIENLDNNTKIFLGRESLKLKSNGIVEHRNGIFKNYYIGNRNFDVSGYHDMVGLTWVAEKDILRYRQLLDERTKESCSDYYFTPLINNSEDFDLRCFILSKPEEAFTFNTTKAYKDILFKMNEKYKVVLFDVSSLKHIEDFSLERVTQLKDKILSDGVWIRPLCITKEGLVMDGQHRMEIAKKLGIKRVPVIIFSYDDIKFYSLRDDFSVSKEEIENRVMENNIYPYKTVKHIFPEEVLTCNYTLEELLDESGN